MGKLPIAVIARAHDPAQILHCIEAIGNSKQRLSVFRAVYAGKQKERSVQKIMEATGLDEKQTRGCLKHLFDHHLCKLNGRGNNTVVEKEKFCTKYRDQIIRGVERPATKEKYELKAGQIGSKPAALGVPKPKAVGSVRKRVSKSKNLVILFLTTNPDMNLRTDQEFRAVEQQKEKSEKRDQIELVSVVAASFEDFISAINKISPDVVHFSGHGNVGEIVFDGNQLGDAAVPITFELLKKVLNTAKNTPKLIMLNSCYGAIRAQDLLDPVPAVVGMANEIDDAAAAIFSRQLYSSLFEGQSIHNAVIQGKAVLEAMSLPDAELPTIVELKDNDATSKSLI